MYRLLAGDWVTAHLAERKNDELDQAHCFPRALVGNVEVEGIDNQTFADTWKTEIKWASEAKVVASHSSGLILAI